MNTIDKIYRRCAPTAVCVAIWLLGSAGITAQTWEHIYGGDECEDTGFNNVAPVSSGSGTCGDPNATPNPTAHGYISVGQTNTLSNGSCGDNWDVYIVRTKNDGSVWWRRSYDIGGAGNDDIGYSIKELANSSGFIVTGITQVGAGNYDIFIMKTNCRGVVQWVNTYGGASDDMAFDIIETTTGTGGLGTSAGDFVVAGWTTSAPYGTVDAYLLRTNQAGVLIWDAAYELSGIPPTETNEDWFNSLTEATPNSAASQTTGDIVAVGGTNEFALTWQAIVARVDGNTGAIAPGPPSLQNFSDYGSTGNEEFFEVRELTVSGQTGNLAFAGYTTTPDVNGTSDIYIATSGGDPCSTPLVQGYVGTSDEFDEAYGLREVTTISGVTSNMATGDLALTGKTSGYSGTDYYMFLLTVDPANLTVTSANVYGLVNQTNKDEVGHSLYEVVSGNGRSNGFILCGITFSDPALTMDTWSMYLVKTDADGVTTADECSHLWEPVSDDVNWTNNCRTPTIYSVATTTASSSENPTVGTDYETCDLCENCKRTVGPQRSQGARMGNARAEITTRILRSYPNPVRQGGVLHLEFAPATKESISVTVMSALGEIVRTVNVPNVGNYTQFTVSTDGWAAGTYMVRITDGIRVNFVRVVVVD